jgi:hypothetical protein
MYVYLWYFVVILLYLFRFGMLCQEKSGNPAFDLNSKCKSNLSRRRKNIFSQLCYKCTGGRETDSLQMNNIIQIQNVEQHFFFFF